MQQLPPEIFVHYITARNSIDTLFTDTALAAKELTNNFTAENLDTWLDYVKIVKVVLHYRT